MTAATDATGARYRPDGAALAVSALCALAAVGLFVIPFATVSRSFNGAGALLVHPERIIDFTGFLPKTLPDFSAVTIVNWVLLAALVALAALAWTRSRLLVPAGVTVALLVALSVFAFVRAIDATQLPMLAQGVAYRRLPFREFGPSLGAFLAFGAAVAAAVLGLARDARRAERLGRLRGGLVPVVALLLSMLVGAVVILVIQPVPGAASGEQTLFRSWIGKIDLLWFSYASLLGPALPRFRPAFDLAGPWLSLAQATPLVFTGLALAFAFRTGLFNIGASGQIVMGGIFAMLAGVYLPAPWPIGGPITVIAAALGGGLWGAIPGWLKARFGSSEVINTIMLNYVAAGLLIFLIGSNQASFFGRTIALPFKQPGSFEAKSVELSAGSRLAQLVPLVGLTGGDNVVNLGPWLLAAGFLVTLAAWRGPLRRRVVPAVVAAALGLVVGLVLFPAVHVPISGAMASARLNVSFLIALLAAAFVSVFLWRTRYGYELRAVGLAPKAAQYGGVNIGRNIVLAMAVSGALAGLAATHYVQGAALDEYRLKQSIPADTAGFGGITVALLGQNTPVGVIAASALFGVMSTGGLNLDQALDKISRDIVTVLQALIVLFIATRGFLVARAAPRAIPGEPAASYPKAGGEGKPPLEGQEARDPDAVEESRA